MITFGADFSRVGSTLAWANNWLNRRRIILFCSILLMIEIVVWVGVFFSARNTTYIPDFRSFYGTGMLANSGQAALAYDHAAQWAAQQAVVGLPTTDISARGGYFFYPPVFLMLCVGLAKLSFIPALVVFEATALAGYLLAARAIVGQRGWAIIVPFLTFPPVFWNLIQGQNGLLTAALFGAATLLIDRRPVIAGLLFGTICYKPQMGLLIPVALVAGRHWRAFAAASASVVFLCLASLLAFGWSAWRAFFEHSLTNWAAYDHGPLAFKGFLSPFGAVRLLGGSPGVAYVMQAVATALAVIVVAWVWRRRLPLAIRAATLASATLIAFPVISYYDLVLNGIAAAWLYGKRNPTEADPSEKIVLVLLVLFMVYGLRLGDWIPIVAMIGWTFTAIVVARAWQADVAAGL